MIINTNNNKYPMIKIRHVPTDKSVEFIPYISDFSDNFASKWEGTETFGRMDEIKTFSRTTRTISLTFNVISENLSEAKKNYSSISTLMAFLYPTFSEIAINTKASDILNGQSTLDGQTELDPDQQQSVESVENQAQMQEKMKNVENVRVLNEQLAQSQSERLQYSRLLNSPPILQINFSNLIKNTGEISGNGGLYGVVEGLIYKPDVQSGFFIDQNPGKMYAKVVEISFSFTVIHTSPLGWSYDKEENEFKLNSSLFPLDE